MTRSGYSDDCDSDFPIELYRNAVNNAIKGKRGQSFLKELAKTMDDMPVKELIAGELVTEKGECCTMGTVFKARGINVDEVDYDDAACVAKSINIAPCLASEIAYLNDDDFGYVVERQPGWINGMSKETPAERWQRMRTWVAKQIKIEETTNVQQNA